MESCSIYWVLAFRLKLMKRISIIVPAHNEETTIIPLLASVQEAINNIPEAIFEVIVIDDASTDDTASLLRNNTNLYDQYVR